MRERLDDYIVPVAVLLTASLACSAFLAGFTLTKEPEDKYLDLLRRCESVLWRQGGEVGRECPICFGDTMHLEGCELAEALEMER